MRAALLISLALLAPLSAVAQEEDAQRIQFEKGKSSTEIRGSLAVRDSATERMPISSARAPDRD